MQLSFALQPGQAPRQDMYKSDIKSKIRNDNALSNLFKGCFSPSELAFVDLDPDKDHALILNTDDWPGQHWLSVFFCFTTKEIFVFDSRMQDLPHRDE